MGRSLGTAEEIICGVRLPHIGWHFERKLDNKRCLIEGLTLMDGARVGYWLLRENSLPLKSDATIFTG